MGFNAVQFYEFGKGRNAYEPNTFIGGVASVINTPDLLALKLLNYPSETSFSASNIKNFTIKGNDIECYIWVDYMVKDYAFDNSGGAKDWGNGNIITYYQDNNNKIKKIGINSFYNQNKINKISLAGCVFVDNSSFRLLTNLSIANLPNCIKYGGTTDLNFVFYQAKQGLKVYANPSMATVFNGGVEGDLAYVTNILSGSIVYVTNFTKPSTITDLSVTTVYATAIKLDWSIPTSTNAIEFYEVYVDGFYNKTVTTNSAIITGLTNLQTYTFTVKAVDIFYNKSIVSNTVIRNINGVGAPLQESIISYYKFENNVLDSVGSNNGIATSIIYVSGKVGKSADFNGTSSKVSLGTSQNIVIGATPFSISLLIKLDVLNDPWFFNKLNSFDTNREFFYVYQHSQSRILFQLYDKINAASLSITYNVSLLADTWYDFTISWNGNNTINSLNLYVNGLLVASNGENINFQSVLSGSSETTIGVSNHSNLSYLNGKIDELSIFNKALTQTEVTEIYNLHNSGLPLI